MEPHDLAKLPKWAQEYIYTIERRCDDAVSDLKDFLDHQTQSPIYVSRYSSQAEKIFVQSTDITLEAGDLKINAAVRDSMCSPPGSITINGDHSFAVIPISSNMIALVTRKWT